MSQTTFWDLMPPGFHIPNFLHSKDSRTSKPGKKNLTAAPKKQSTDGTRRMPKEGRYARAWPTAAAAAATPKEELQGHKKDMPQGCGKSQQVAILLKMNWYEHMSFLTMALSIKTRAHSSSLLTQIETAKNQNKTKANPKLIKRKVLSFSKELDSCS